MKSASDDGPVLLVGGDNAVADTQCGKVRGYVLRGIHYYLGIPYGADTSGTNRFMPPRKPKAWTGLRPALWWGNSAPQNMDSRYANAFPSFRDHWNYDDVSEDCLRLNVFGDKAKDVVEAYAKAFPGRKPVEIWSLVSANRQSAAALADARSKQPAAVYMAGSAGSRHSSTAGRARSTASTSASGSTTRTSC